MSFKKMRGVRLPEEKQGLIRYTCLNYNDLRTHEQNKIRRLCEEQGGQYAAALWEVMCTREGVTSIALRHHVSESVLCTLRRKFYESW